MKDLRLPLERRWFEMTEPEIKKEDYREITPYWCNRILLYQGKEMSKLFWESIISPIKNIEIWLKVFPNDISFKKFTINTMTLGYPKSTDTERILQFYHRGIEIRTGNPEWGAVPGKLYFVIMHGDRL